MLSSIHACDTHEKGVGSISSHEDFANDFGVPDTITSDVSAAETSREVRAFALT